MKFISVVYLNMFWASLCPSSGEQEHMVFCTGCAGRGRVELGRKLSIIRSHDHPQGEYKVFSLRMIV